MQFSLEEKIGKESLLSIVPGLSESILEFGSVELATAGQKIAEQGQCLAELVIPVNEPILLIRTDGGREAYRGYLQRSRSLGLGFLLADTVLPYDAVIERDTVIAKLPRQKFVECLDKTRGIRDYLQLMTQSAGFRSFAKFILERETPRSKFIAWFASAGHREFSVKSGSPIPLTGPQFILVDEGSLKVMRKSGMNPESPILVGAGAWLGGSAVVPPFKYSFGGITAQEDTKGFLIDISSFPAFMPDPELIEAVQSDPWLRNTSFTNSESIVTNLNLPRLDPAQLRTLELGIPLDQLIPARSDHQASAASLANLCTLRAVKASFSSFESELATISSPRAAHMAFCLESAGIICTAYTCGTKELHRFDLPALCLIGPRWMVLLAARDTYVVLADPCSGIVACAHERLAQIWNGRLLGCRPVEIPESLPPKKSSDESPDDPENQLDRQIRSIFIEAAGKIIKPFRPFLVNAFLLSLFSLAIGIIMPKLSQYMIDEVARTNDWGLILAVAAGTFLLIVFQFALGVLQGILNTEIRPKIDFKTDLMFIRSYFRQAPSDKSTSGPGETVSVKSEFDSLQEFAISAPSIVISNTLAILGYSAVLLTYDYRLLLMSFSILPVLFAIRALYKPRLLKLQAMQFETSKRLNGFANEQISSMSAIKASNAELFMRRRWEDDVVESTVLAKRTLLEQESLEFLVGLSYALLDVATLGLGILLVMRAQISIGEVFAVRMYVQAISAPLDSLLDFIIQLDRYKIALARVSQFLFPKENATNTPATASRQSRNLSGKIRLDRVSFKYEGATEWAVSDVSLTIYPKQIIALVGRSGCGKSTLAKVIAGRVQPSTGRIFYDGFDSTSLNNTSVRRQIGFVMQDSVLFAGSVRDNVSFADDAPDPSALEEAIGNSGSMEFVQNLPGGDGYYLTEGGLGLSGGQKQRLNIARCFYPDPALLVLDEATSALDGESEEAVVAGLRRVLNDKTAIIIAHRFSTIRTADRIIVMQSGKIVEDGTHPELIKRNGHYAELFKNQISTSTLDG